MYVGSSFILNQVAMLFNVDDKRCFNIDSTLMCLLGFLLQLLNFILICTLKGETLKEEKFWELGSFVYFH